jgi:hypothetical protein
MAFFEASALAVITQSCGHAIMSVQAPLTGTWHWDVSELRALSNAP